MSFGPEYLIPKPFDPRLIVKIAPAVAQAAMDSGVANASDRGQYTESLQQFVYQRYIHETCVCVLAKKNTKECGTRVVFAEGEDERVLRAVQVIADEKIARPVGGASQSGGRTH